MNQGYRIDIDGVCIGQYLSCAADSAEFEGLVPVLGLYSKSDRKKAAELVSQINVRFPVLVCGTTWTFSVL